jgi:hypothetical protein
MTLDEILQSSDSKEVIKLVNAYAAAMAHKPAIADVIMAATRILAMTVEQEEPQERQALIDGILGLVKLGMKAAAEVDSVPVGATIN